MADRPLGEQRLLDALGPGEAADGEMEEIAASLTADGLPGGFHEAAAELYERLAAEPGTDLDALLDALSVRYVAPGSGDGPAKGDTWR